MRRGRGLFREGQQCCRLVAREQFFLHCQRRQLGIRGQLFAGLQVLGCVALLNADFSLKWPNIAEKKEALPEAEEFKDKKGKRQLLVAQPGAKR